ncbi:MAG: Stp1/IreP family PP2C-type Ser/Thr phosphatase [Candidatus Sericytochromatia bacterium]|nr:Stp1/IreP family PP2C-type Ser/Thr phosphatase [Candidatus Sericytochromatia bacterium]
MRASGYTDVGRIREVNQDSFAAIDLLGLYIVADGMGGHAAGEKASLSAVTTGIEIFSAYDFETKKLSGSDVDLGIEDVLKIALKEANNRIIQASISSIHLQGMGTTEVIALYSDMKLYLGNVGDSRGYLVKADGIKQVTRDHSVVQDLKDQGLITEEEAKVHPYRNVITRCLGMQAEIEVDTFVLDLEIGDRIIMCTDGLTNLVSDEEIQQFVFENDDLEAICKKLVATANERGGHDNITVVLLDIDGKD